MLCRLICLGALLAGVSSFCAGDPPQFVSGVTLVHVDVQVNDPAGNAVAGLKQSDFRVFDEGVEQPIVAFAADEQPLDLVFLVDVSGSMRVSVQHFAPAELRRGDRVAVMTFAGEPHLFSQFTDDLHSVEETLGKLQKVRFFGSTHIDDGIYEAASLFFALHFRDWSPNSTFPGGDRESISRMELSAPCARRAAKWYAPLTLTVSFRKSCAVFEDVTAFITGCLTGPRPLIVTSVSIWRTASDA